MCERKDRERKEGNVRVFMSLLLFTIYYCKKRDLEGNHYKLQVFMYEKSKWSGFYVPYQMQ